MPLARRVALTQRRGWNDADRLYLATGHDFFGESQFPAIRTKLCTNPKRNPPDVDLMNQAWAEIGHEIMAERIQEWPCCRPWYWWVHIALPENTRLRLVDDAYGDGTSEPRAAEVWHATGGFEPSLHYLLRRGLLEAGELDHARRHYADDTQRFIEQDRFRHDLSKQTTVTPPWALAGAAFIGGVDLLDARQLDDSLDWLNTLRKYMEGQPC